MRYPILHPPENNRKQKFTSVLRGQNGIIGQEWVKWRCNGVWLTSLVLFFELIYKYLKKSYFAKAVSL